MFNLDKYKLKPNGEIILTINITRLPKELAFYAQPLLFHARSLAGSPCPGSQSSFWPMERVRGGSGN